MFSCAFCGESVSRSGARGPVAKYCSATCSNRAKWLRQKAANPCPHCGRPMSRPGKTSSANPKCSACRSKPHGASRYRRGCRCSECKDAVAKRQRDYVARRAARGDPVDFAKYRAAVSAECESCGRSFMARADSTRGRFCSVDCANDSQGRAPTPRFRIAKSVRLAIYEAANWECQLCFGLVRPDEEPAHPRYPTLDHIVPRARGGSDDPGNLRLACFQCNTRRGTNMDWVPEVIYGRLSDGDIGVAV